MAASCDVTLRATVLQFVGVDSAAAVGEDDANKAAIWLAGTALPLHSVDVLMQRQVHSHVSSNGLLLILRMHFTCTERGEDAVVIRSNRQVAAAMHLNGKRDGGYDNLRTLTISLLAGWFGGCGAASVQLCVQMPALGWRVVALDGQFEDGPIAFDASFDGADALSKALEQPCRQVGLTCLVEDDSFGKAVVVRKMAERE